MATADELIDTGSQQVANFSTEVELFIDDLRNFVVDVGLDVDLDDRPSITYYTDFSDFTSALRATPSIGANSTYNAPAQPGAAPTDFDIRDEETIDIPTLTDTSPVLDIPAQPDFTLPTEPTAPTVNEVEAPSAPSLNLPAVPTLVDVDIPDAINVNLPAFEESFPVDPTLLVPTDEFSFVEEDYQNDVLDAAEAQLLIDIRDEGWGISTDDELALYERQKDRAAAEGVQQENEIYRSFASRGFRLPTGATVALLEAARQLTDNKRSDANRDVSINRAEIYRRAREFAIQQGLSLNQILIQNHGFKQERALNAARFAAEFTISVFDAAVRRHNFFIERYRQYIEAYKAQVEAKLSEIEIFKTQVDAAVAKQTINQSIVDVYRAQIGASEAIVGLFETQMKAAQIEVEIENSKIEAFRARVQAYVAQVDARKLNIDSYKAAIDGEQSKVDIYRAQVAAYNSTVEAANIKSQIQSRNIANDIAEAELVLRGYETEIETFKTNVQAEVSRLESVVNIYQADTQQYSAVMGGWSSFFNNVVRAQESFIRQLDNDIKLDQEAVKIELSRQVQEAQLRLSAINTGTSVFGNLLSSAQSTLNAVVYKDDE